MRFLFSQFLPAAVSRVGAICLLGFALQAAASEADLRYFLTNVDTLSAKFEQHVVDETGFTLEQTSGQVFLSRPGRFRWDYFGVDEFADQTLNNGEAPSILQQQIIADGESLYLYDPELEQATQRSLQLALGQVPSLLLVQSNSDIDRHFNISDFGVTDGMTWVLLKPKEQEASYQQLMLGFKNQTLGAIILFDGLGNETRLVLSEVENNARLSTALFDFELPDGVDLLKE